MDDSFETGTAEPLQQGRMPVAGGLIMLYTHIHLRYGTHTAIINNAAFVRRVRRRTGRGSAENYYCSARWTVFGAR